MTDTLTVPATTAVPPAAPPPARSSATRWIVAAVALLAAGGAWLGWSAQQRLQQLESELVKRQEQSQDEAKEARLLAKQALDNARDAVAKSALLETRLAEVTLQRGQLDDLVKTMSRSRDETLLVDVEANLRVAVRQATLTGSAEPLVSALQNADERLLRAQQPRLEPVRRAIAKDLDRLKSTRVADLSILAVRMDEAVRMVDALPLLSEPGKQSDRADAAAAASAPARANARKAAKAAHAASQAASSPDADPVWSDRVLDWSQKAGQTVWQEARSLVRLTRITQPEGMLIAPEQAFFLRENLKLRLLNARLGLLSRQTATANADIQSAQQAIKRYFDVQSRRTQGLQSLLADIAAQSPQTQLPRPDDTLAALATLSGGR
ncbi:MAG: uroporphyrinogen-III C-methyltransferase [Aquabacterium sp.]|uniref:uroporphyrinogen-III C-methyltransferase n=1 Tax=Aquabacterium sp. TaxID=1872578 RepID=UPI003BAE4900